MLEGPDRGDRELIKQVEADAPAFAELYRRHVRRVTTYAATRCRRPEDVADLVATTFVAAIDSVRRYEPARGEVLPWLIGIARRLSFDSAVYAQRERDALAKIAGWRSLDDGEIADLQARIDAAHHTAKLQRDREPLLLIGHVGLTHAQAAQTLGISGASFQIRLLRARRTLPKPNVNSTDSKSGPARNGHVTSEPLTRVEQRLLNELLAFHVARQHLAGSTAPLAADIPRFAQPPRRSHLAQNLVLSGMVLAVGIMLLVRVTGLGGSASAATPPPPHYTPPGAGAPSGSGLLRALARTADRQPPAACATRGRYAYVKVNGWYTIGGQGSAVGRTFPQSTQSWMLLDGAGRSLTVTGTGSHRRVDDLHNRPVYPPMRFKLSTDPRVLAAQLAVRHPRSDGRVEQIVAFEDLARQQPIRPAAEAAILRLLARIPHLVNRGTVTDRAGRHGVAVSLDASSYGERQTLILDPHTGQLLSFAETVTRETNGEPEQFPVGAVLSYTDILSSGYVNNTNSTP